MTALKWITTEAKKIRKKYPKKEWKDCVKQASAIYASKHGGKSPVEKKKKKAIGAVKKVAKKKTAKKKTTKKSGEYHKDTKSHNVNIRVVSGIDKNVLTMVNDYVKTIKRMEGDLEGMINTRKKFPNDKFTPSLQQIKHKKEQITRLKKSLNKLKKAL